MDDRSGRRSEELDGVADLPSMCSASSSSVVEYDIVGLVVDSVLSGGSVPASAGAGLVDGSADWPVALLAQPSRLGRGVMSAMPRL
jgi:hypothetical protein